MKKQHKIWLTDFLRNCEASNRSPRTIQNYRADLQKFIRWHEANYSTPLNRANAKTIGLYKDYLSSGTTPRPQPKSVSRVMKKIGWLFKRMLNVKKGPELLEEGQGPGSAGTAPPVGGGAADARPGMNALPLSVSSRRRHLSAIKNFYEYLKQANEDSNKLFAANPVKPKLHAIKLKEQDVENTKLLKEVDWKAINRAVYRPKEKLIVNILYYGGLRLTELCELKISNFDRENHSVKFHRKGGYVHNLKLQNGEKIFSLLDVYLQTRRQSSDYLFSNKKGSPLSSRAMYDVIMKIFLKSQCETTGLTPHSFRKACATNLYKKTKDLVFVRDYLNHSDAKVTQTYIEKFKLDEQAEKYLAP